LILVSTTSAGDPRGDAPLVAEVRACLDRGLELATGSSDPIHVTRLLEATIDAAHRVVALLETSSPEDRPLVLLNAIGVSSRALADRVQELDEAAGWRQTGNGS
jgi:hypothetical protein